MTTCASTCGRILTTRANNNRSRGGNWYDQDSREAGEGHITQSMHWMWMLPVAVFIFSTMCCWKSARCRRTFDKGFTWLIRRNPRPSSSDPNHVPLVTTQDSDRHATSSQADLDLYHASRDGDLEKVKRLLSTPGVNVNSRVALGSQTPVLEAAYRGHREVVELLESKGADVSLVDKYGDNILHHACMGGDVETVKYVLSLNVVDINARNNRGDTAADWARLWGRQPVVELLKSRGAQ